MDAADVKLINQRVEELAEVIRKYVRSQVAVWRTLPYWMLESQGRNGWLDTAAITYRNRLFNVTGGVKSWPPRILVDCYTGELVLSSATLAPSKTVVMEYLNGMVLDAEPERVALQQRAESDHRVSADGWRRRDDAERNTLRRACDVKPVCTEPATAITWGYSFP